MKNTILRKKIYDIVYERHYNSPPTNKSGKSTCKACRGYNKKINQLLALIEDEKEKILKKIVTKNYDKKFDTYDYDGIAEDIFHLTYEPVDSK